MCIYILVYIYNIYISICICIYMYTYIYIYIICINININIYICYESQPGSWLVVICERSENRKSGGGRCLRGPKASQIGGVLGAQKVWFFRVMYHAAKQ